MAPQDYGIGDWVVLREQGNLVGEVLVKRKAREQMARSSADHRLRVEEKGLN